MFFATKTNVFYEKNLLKRIHKNYDFSHTTVDHVKYFCLKYCSEPHFLHGWQFLDSIHSDFLKSTYLCCKLPKMSYFRQRD